jgi:hypothetical protein
MKALVALMMELGTKVFCGIFVGIGVKDDSQIAVCSAWY